MSSRVVGRIAAAEAVDRQLPAGVLVERHQAHLRTRRPGHLVQGRVARAGRHGVVPLPEEDVDHHEDRLLDPREADDLRGVDVVVEGRDLGRRAGLPAAAV